MESPTHDRVGVLALDDRPIFLDVAQEVMAATHGFRWVAGVTCGEDALDAVAEHEPALVLLDVRMPGRMESRPHSGSRSGIPMLSSC
jgi:DNA-binding NarL/FixJ family response regulator